MSCSLGKAKGLLISLLVCGGVVGLSFNYFDMPIAQLFSGNIGQFNSAGFGSAILLTLEAVTALTVVGIRLLRGHLSVMSRALATASFVSMISYAINDGILKQLLGVPSPQQVLSEGANHAFHVLAGSPISSFPSGHMVLAGSFAGVLMKRFPDSVLPLAVLLLFGAAALIIGDWHFVSDVIAGTFAGVTFGMEAGELPALSKLLPSLSAWWSS